MWECKLNPTTLTTKMAVIRLSRRAWTPVFDSVQKAMNIDSATPGSAGHALQQLELLDTHSLFTGRCPECEMTYPQYETPPVHWDCPECGWMDDSV